jgi:hypothetical protein
VRIQVNHYGTNGKSKQTKEYKEETEEFFLPDDRNNPENNKKKCENKKLDYHIIIL